MESEALLVRSLLKLKLRTRVKEISTGFVSDDYMAYKLSEALIGYFKINFSDQTIKHFDSILQKLNYAAFSDEFRRIKQISKRINKA